MQFILFPHHIVDVDRSKNSLNIYSVSSRAKIALFMVENSSVECDGQECDVAKENSPRIMHEKNANAGLGN